MLSDLWNGLMAFFNLTALLFLTGEVEYSGSVYLRKSRLEKAPRFEVPFPEKKYY